MKKKIKNKKNKNSQTGKIFLKKFISSHIIEKLPNKGHWKI